MKRVRDSPSGLAFSSPEKRRVLSELAATRKVIKNKFKQAYKTRTKLERERKEIFKPILKSIDSLKPDKKAKKAQIKKEKVKNERESPFVLRRPSEYRAVQAPVPSPLRSPQAVRAEVPPAVASTSGVEPQQSVSNSAPLLQMPSDDDGDDDSYEDDDDDDMFATADFGRSGVESSTPKKAVSKKRRLPFDTGTKVGDDKRARAGSSRKSVVATLAQAGTENLPVLTVNQRLTREQARKSKINLKDPKFSYTVVSDYQDLKHYNKPLSDRAPVNVKRTFNYTGKSQLIKTLWKDLPRHVKEPWLKHRKHVYGLFKRGLERYRPENMEVDDTPKRRAIKRNRIGSTSRKLRKRIRANDLDVIDDDVEMVGGSGIRPLDFNFIPYNVKNRVIYEYFDDPNELCERLQLLISSQMAGNSNHMQEINSIIEELRELKCIA